MKKIKDRISNFYNKLIKTKEHIWSHCLALTGWYSILIIIHEQNINFRLFEIKMIFWILILIIFYLYLCEKIILNTYKIKNSFFLNNNKYNIIWLIGILLIIIVIIKTISTWIISIINLIPIY